MLRHYLTITFRNLLNHRVFSLINLLGLTIGLTASLLIVSHVWHELNYDRFHQRADSIYRVITRVKANGSNDGIARTGVAIGPLIKQNFAEVREVVRLKPVPVTLRNGQELVDLKDVMAADPSVLTVFSYRLLQGDSTALNRPNSIVLTESLAQKYFGRSSPLGKLLQLNGEAFRVTGLLADVPSHSDLRFTSLLSWRSSAEEADDWLNTACYTYLLLGTPGQAATLGPKLTRFSEAYFGAKIKALGVFDFSVNNQIQPLTELHFTEGLQEDTPKGNRTALLVLAAIAGLLLLIACINYVNLYIAQSIDRHKEVGVRKVLGAGRPQLAFRFIAESAVLIGLSALLAVVLSAAAGPYFQSVTESYGSTLSSWRWPLVAGLLAALTLVGLLTSSYPALYLSGLEPTRILKGPATGARKPLAQQGLVVIQFSIAIALMVGTLVMQEQLTFLRTKNRGFQREQVLILHVPDEDAIRQKMPALRQILASDSRIGAVSSGHPPVNMGFKASFVKETDGQKVNLFINTALIDESYLDVLNLKLLAGRNFTGPADREHQVLVNEAFVKWMGWTEAVGRKINPSASDSLTARVIGVVKDFHYQSLHHAIEPLLIYYGGDRPVSLLVRAKPQHLAVIQQAWHGLVPDRPFSYTFLDDSYNRQYRREETMLKLIGWFSGLTILIACLGLFGLATFAVQRRTREIGIRKVLGASLTNLVALLSRDFLKPVLLALVFAFLFAWYAVDRWLEGFAYKVAIDGWMFVLAGASAVLIALATVSFQAVKAALTNPVDSLKRE